MTTKNNVDLELEGRMFEKALQRDKNFFNLSDEEQWEIDRKLGILDWRGGCSHDIKLCKPCMARLNEHFFSAE